MARASTIGENAALSGSGGLTGITTFFGVNTGDPGTTGASEVTGGSPAYARTGITWGSAAGGSIQNTNTLTVNIPASTTITYFSGWNTGSISGGTGYVVGGALSASQTYSSQGTFTVAVGGLTIAIS